MTGDEAIPAVIDALNSLEIPFMIVGSLATNFYGVPRSTRDADFVVALMPQPLAELSDRLGPRFRVDPQTSFETITGTTRHQISVAGTAFTVELFMLTDDPHDVSRFARREHVRLFERDVPIATAEDTIVTKLRWGGHVGRDKDLTDVRNVIAVQGDSLDWAYILSWCQAHGTVSLLESVRKSLPA